MPDALTGPGVMTRDRVRYKISFSPAETGRAVSIIDSGPPASRGEHAGLE
ncbi:hypothetical protein H7H48_02935 [Nitratireductor sp. B36]|nr:hypothetical protein [Nitratireductor sp. B36]MCC5777992.1 hypothetical protein [Nitratireductor sp. B36]